MATTMTVPFYLEIGFSKTQIGTVVKLFGFWATLGGSLLGGLIMLRMGYNLTRKKGIVLFALYLVYLASFFGLFPPG